AGGPRAAYQMGRPGRARERNRDRRPVHARQAADLDEAGSEERAGVPRREGDVRLALLDRAADGEERAGALVPCSVAGLLVHRDDLRGVDHLEAAGERADLRLAAEEDRLARPATR